MVANPGARRDLLKFFEAASFEGQQPTMLVGPELMKNGKGCLARWTGDELVIIELSAGQRASLGLGPNHLIHQVEPRPIDPSPHMRAMTLDTPLVDAADSHDGYQRLTGACCYEFDAPDALPIGDCVLQVQYFRPDLAPRRIGYWHPPGNSLLPPHGEMRFYFSPLFSKDLPATVHGTLIVFLQLLTVADLHTMRGAKAASNVAAAVVNLR
ncbi:MAG TPA: hypothetical protein VGN42_16335 [Pirellulales bacterium]|nr:hypothetical protein [Pirellulales bacterium]